MLSVNAVQTSRLTRKASTELTRRRLIDGAIEILRRDGFAAATTGRIASAAGLKQPSFYVHFDDRDQVFEAAANEIGRRVIGDPQAPAHRDRPRAPAPIDPRRLRGHDRGVPLGAGADAHLPAPPHRRRDRPRPHVPPPARPGARASSSRASGATVSCSRATRPRRTSSSSWPASSGFSRGCSTVGCAIEKPAVDAISNVTIAMFRSLTRDRAGSAPAASSRARPKEQK